MKYLLVDAFNLIHRTWHASSRSQSDEERMALSIHIFLMTIKSSMRQHGLDHVVVCGDRRSWRKDVYAPYKANRAVARLKQTLEQAEESTVMTAGLDDLMTYLKQYTHITMLDHAGCEADDFIARFIQLHDQHDHVILSSDSDFQQLVSDRVQLYDGVNRRLYNLQGIWDDKGAPVLDKKTGLPCTVQPELILFEKCIRGDASDNIASAYPGVRREGGKKTSIMQAWQDRHDRSYAWNNFMQVNWQDAAGVVHQVGQDYARNRQLIDLTAQPDHVIAVLDAAIAAACTTRIIPQLGMHFLKFCHAHALTKLAESHQDMVKILSAGYAA